MIDNTIWYYKSLDFPELPEELKNKFDELIKEKLLEVPAVKYTKENLNELGYFNYLKSPSTQVGVDKFVPGGEMIYTELTPEFESWFRNNISETAKLPRFATHMNDPAHPITFLAAHCDFQRNYALNYVHVPGGKKVKTVFYQEQGHPVIRGTAVVGYKAPLIKLAEINIPVNTWHLLRTDIIHSVEFMTSPRIRITSNPDQAEIDAFAPHVVDTLK